VILLVGAIQVFLLAGWLIGLGQLIYYSVQWQRILPDKIKQDSMNKESGDLTKRSG